MGIWEKPGAKDARMMQVLQRLAEGFDPQGNRVSVETQQHAIQQYQQMRAERDRIAIESARQASQSALDRARAEAELRRVAVEEGRLDLDEFKVKGQLQIEQMEVAVKAIAVAAQAGVEPGQIMEAIQGLLPGKVEGQELKQLEDKKE